jgi:hypothetical protein
MNLLNNIMVCMLLIGFNVPVVATIDNYELISCNVFSDKSDGNGGDKEDGKINGEEEEPDCE